MAETAYTPRLRERYQALVPLLKDRFQLKNVHQVARIEKVVVSMGVGKGVADAKYLEAAEKLLAAVTGQKPVKTRARKAIAGFKLREGVEIGLMVTLRGTRMYEFLDRFISVALPRIRDFHGLSPRSFDGRGNLSVGIKEATVFPEVAAEGLNRDLGLAVSIETTAKTNEHALALLQELGFPFRKEHA